MKISIKIPGIYKSTNLQILVILEYIPIFFSKMPLSSLFNVVECEVVSLGALFYPGALLKLGESEFRKYSKVPIYFVQGFLI